MLFTKLSFFSSFAIVLSIYCITSYRGVPGGDSGELLAESCIRGVSHPPGYPLFSMLSIAVQTLTSNVGIIGSVAFSVNILCSVFGAAAAGFIALITEKLVHFMEHRDFEFVCAILGGILFGFSPLTWEYSITAEVFSLNNFLCALLLYLACESHVRWFLGGDSGICKFSRCLWAGAFFSALAFTNQHTSILQTSYLIVWMLALLFLSKASTQRKFSVLGGCAVSFVAGLSPYLYLYAIAQHPTRGSWGDVTTMSGLLRHVLRAEYGTFQLGLAKGKEGFVERVWLYLKHVSAESGYTILPVVGTGLILAAMASPVDSELPAAPAQTAPAVDMKVEQSDSQAVRRRKNMRVKAEKKPEQREKPAENAPVLGMWRRNLLLQLYVMLLALWVVYVVVWHAVFSNLPLSSPMPYAVHSRFWMQPSLVLYALFGVSVHLSVDKLSRLFGKGVLSVIVNLGGIVTVAALLWVRYPLLDRSQTGTAMQAYGLGILDSLPESALLLSHTDLDWNTVRYLQACEGLRPDVTHLSLQLIPYPWFKHRQQPLYPHVKFADVAFSGVSTDRLSEGNARLVLDFLRVNEYQRLPLPWANSSAAVFSGGIYVDMQAINEVDIADMGLWRGVATLVPWGAVYRVLRKLDLAECQQMHRYSWEQLQRLKSSFPAVDQAYLRQYPAGSWEFAAASVHYDAHYQLGLSLLTFSMSLQQSNLSLDTIPVIMDRLWLACEILEETRIAMLRFETISSPPSDVHKNTAVAWLRLITVMPVVEQFRDSILEKMASSGKSEELLRRDELFRWAEAREGTVARAAAAIEGFLERYPDDKDQALFRSSLLKIKAS